MKVLGLGDNVCDIYLHTNTMYPGGQALNFAVYAGMLGVSSDFLGVNGSDAVAEHVRQTLKEKNIGLSHCRQYPGANGLCCVTLREGDRVFLGSNRGGVIQGHPIRLREEEMEYLNSFDVIHTTNNGFLDSQLPILASCRGFLSYDFSYRWNEPDRIQRVSPYLDFAFYSAGDMPEERILDISGEIQSLGHAIVIATRGSKGALVLDGQRIYKQEPHTVKAVDTIGAGDSFATCLLVRAAQGALADSPERQELRASAHWKNPGRREEILRGALEEAAEFSSKICLIPGAFGCGTRIPEKLRPEINQILDSSK